MLRICARLLFLLAPAVALAAGSTGVITLTNVNIQVITSPAIAYVYAAVSSGGCTYSNPAVLIMDSTNPQAGAQYGTLVAAKLGGNTVNITTSGCSSSGYPIISSVYIES